MKPATLSLILPVRNAAAALPAVVQDCLLILPQHVADFEIIIVDDGSRDATAEVAIQLAAHEPVQVLRQPRPRGYGRALALGMRHARGDCVLTLDVTGTISVGEVARMQPYLAQYDLVQGYRMQRTSATWRRPLEGWLLLWTNRLLRLDLRDIDCRVVLLRAELLHGLKLRAARPLIHAELYARARQRHARCVQVALPERSPTPFYAGSRGTRWRWWLTPGTLWELLRLWADMRWSDRRPHRGDHSSIAAAGWWLAAALRGAWLLLRRRQD